MKKIIIDPEVFQKFPSFVRGVVVARGANIANKNSELEQKLNDAIAQHVGQQSFNHEYVQSWEQVHRDFGSNPNRFPPSIKQLLKRVDGGKGLPFINTVVAIMNYISLTHLIPCGGDDVDQVQGNLVICPATGEESFIGLGSSENEPPVPGEMIYVDDVTNTVMCRRWNWRNGDATKITPDTTNLVMNVDGIGSIPPELVQSARDELADLLRTHTGAEIELGWLDQENSQLEIK